MKIRMYRNCQCKQNTHTCRAATVTFDICWFVYLGKSIIYLIENYSNICAVHIYVPMVLWIAIHFSAWRTNTTHFASVTSWMDDASITHVPKKKKTHIILMSIDMTNVAFIHVRHRHFNNSILITCSRTEHANNFPNSFININCILWR